jgi:hypothetical protein
MKYNKRYFVAQFKDCKIVVINSKYIYPNELNHLEQIGCEAVVKSDYVWIKMPIGVAGYDSFK